MKRLRMNFIARYEATWLRRSRWGTRFARPDVNIERTDRVLHLRADSSGVYDG
jgi:hypothetical protein